MSKLDIDPSCLKVKKIETLKDKTEHILTKTGTEVGDSPRVNPLDEYDFISKIELNSAKQKKLES